MADIARIIEMEKKRAHVRVLGRNAFAEYPLKFRSSTVVFANQVKASVARMHVKNAPNTDCEVAIAREVQNSLMRHVDDRCDTIKGKRRVCKSKTVFGQQRGIRNSMMTVSRSVPSISAERI